MPKSLNTGQASAARRNCLQLSVIGWHRRPGNRRLDPPYQLRTPGRAQRFLCDSDGIHMNRHDRCRSRPFFALDGTAQYQHSAGLLVQLSAWVYWTPRLAQVGWLLWACGARVLSNLHMYVLCMYKLRDIGSAPSWPNLDEETLDQSRGFLIPNGVAARPQLARHPSKPILAPKIPPGLYVLLEDSCSPCPCLERAFRSVALRTHLLAVTAVNAR